MMQPARWIITLIVLSLALASACAGSPERRSTPAVAERRTKDSASERAASLRAADRGLRLEEDEQRWGIAQARERKRREDEARARAQRMTEESSPDVGGRATPAALPQR